MAFHFPVSGLAETGLGDLHTPHHIFTVFVTGEGLIDLITVTQLPLHEVANLGVTVVGGQKRILQLTVHFPFVLAGRTVRRGGRPRIDLVDRRFFLGLLGCRLRGNDRRGFHGGIRHIGRFSGVIFLAAERQQQSKGQQKATQFFHHFHIRHLRFTVIFGHLLL